MSYKGEELNTSAKQNRDWNHNIKSIQMKTILRSFWILYKAYDYRPTAPISYLYLK